jgi:vacuolar-type H+-ATPase subunit C/Vma6
VAEDYTYTVARLRAIEAAMPDKAWFQRLARTPEGGMLNALREYYPAFEGVASLAEFEGGLEAEKLDILELVSALVPDRGADEFLRAGYDFDNLVHVWKASRLGAVPTLVPFGLVDTERIEGAVRGEGRGGLPDHLAVLLERLRAMGDGEDLLAAELTGEQAKWDFLRGKAPGEPAREYIRVKIDLVNIKNYIRFKRVELRGAISEAAWVDGGEIETVRWRSFFREPEDELYKFLEITNYRNLLRFGLEGETPLWRIEPILDAQLLLCIDGSRYRFFDISPVIYHLELHERNERLLREIIVGSMNRLPEDMMLEKVDALLLS